MSEEQVPQGIDEEGLAMAIEGDPFFEPTEIERQYKFREVLKNVLPYLGSSEGKIVLAEVMIALKLEGIIGKTLSTQDTKMLKTLHESIMITPVKKQDALRFARRLLK